MTTTATSAFRIVCFAVLIGALGCESGDSPGRDAGLGTDGAVEDAGGNVGGSGGGAVASGAPLELATELTSNGVIAGNATHIYFEARGNVSRVPVTGGPVQRVIEGSSGVSSIALDETAVFVLDNGGFVPTNGAIRRMAFAGIPGEPTTVIMNQANVDSLVAAGGDLVWISSSLADTTIKSMPKTGTAPVAVAMLGNQAWFGGLASVGPDILYGHRIAMGSGVSSAPRAGGGVPKVLLMGQSSQVLSFAADSDGIYFSTGTGGTGNANDGKLWKAPLTGGAVTMLAGGINEPGRLIADGANIYFLDAGMYDGNYKQGSIKKVAKAGGAPKTVVASVDPFASKNAYTIVGGSLFFLADATVPGMKSNVRLLMIQK